MSVPPARITRIEWMRVLPVLHLRDAIRAAVSLQALLPVVAGMVLAGMVQESVIDRFLGETESEVVDRSVSQPHDEPDPLTFRPATASVLTSTSVKRVRSRRDGPAVASFSLTRLASGSMPGLRAPTRSSWHPIWSSPDSVSLLIHPARNRQQKGNTSG